MPRRKFCATGGGIVNLVRADPTAGCQRAVLSIERKEACYDSAAYPPIAPRSGAHPACAPPRAWGHFAQSLGLLDQFATVPLAQKTVPHAPAAKLLTCLVGVLAGNEHLADLSHGPAPIEHDLALAIAWGLPAFPEASSVSRTLAAADPATLQALQRVLATLSQPFLDRALADLRTRAAPLRFDLDLMGRPVTRHSHSYPDAAFGYMDGSLHLGYQLAMVCLHTDLYDRQWLAAIQHPGNTPSASCLRELVAAAETRVGLHPRRRPDLVAGRLAALDAAVGAAQAHATRYSALAMAATEQEDTLLAEVAAVQAAGWQADPPTRAALARQIATLQHRVGRLRQQWAAAVTRRDHAVERVARLSAQRPALQAWQDHLGQENTVAEATPRCIVRADAGFSSGANLSYLLELGYEVETRANNPAVARALRQRVTPTTAWTTVGPGTQMAVWPDYYAAGCPYPLWAGLEQWTTADGPRYTALLRSHPDPGTSPVDPQTWFAAYNGRQTIEAGNKQAQGVFHLQHFWSRSAIGMQIQVALTVFAANFVHWAAEWVAARTVTAPPAASAAATLAQVRGAVRVAANSLATVERHDGQVLVRFAALSSLVGWVICVAGPLVIQLGLPMFGVASATG